ncbi:zinc ribbon domain-containing protein [Candidatus Bathyarchaeota archaeon]|nr:zinc ribbon domain-containing protein [Candidatus Bathyarchaeota archaeon]
MELKGQPSNRAISIAGALMIVSLLIPWTMIIGVTNYYVPGSSVEETFAVLEFPLIGYAYSNMNGEVFQGWIEIFPVRSIAALMVLISGVILLKESKRREINVRSITIAITMGLAAPTIFSTIDSVYVSFPQASNLSQSYWIIPIGVVLPIIAGALSVYNLFKKSLTISITPSPRIEGVYTIYKCPFCGHSITANYMYCPNCGAKLTRNSIR